MEDKPIRLSKWTHIMQRKGTYAVFHSLKLSLLFFEKRYENLLKELRFGTTLKYLRKLDSDADTIVAELRRQQLVVPVDYDDNVVLRKKQKEYVYKPSLETIFMLLTDACNLKCEYCFIKGNTLEQHQVAKIMSWDRAQKTIEMYFKNLRLTRFHKTIVFYGGEPLLMFPLFKQIISYIHAKHGKALKNLK